MDVLDIEAYFRAPFIQVGQDGIFLSGTIQMQEQLQEPLPGLGDGVEPGWETGMPEIR